MSTEKITIEDLAEEYAAGVALTCRDNGRSLPEAFVHLLETAYVAGYNHVNEPMCNTNSGDDAKVEIIASGINGGTWRNEYRFGPICPDVIDIALKSAMQDFADDIKYIVEHGAEEYEKMIASRN